MKKAFTLFLILVALGGIGYGIKKVIDQKQEEKRIEEVKKGWHVEILTEYINVREKADRYSRTMSKVNKGEVYGVIKNDLSDPNLYWYQIEFKDGSTGWIANNTSGTYLKDNNNPNDVAIPIIKFDNEEYHVVSIDDINYDHLKVWDDRDDYKITHIVYHEVNKAKKIDQYWIKYTITDKSGKHSSKTQRIIFEITPDEEDVTDFLLYTRN
ncbi:MAG: SH3 domain-containing protein [Firmicutes bacterium]|nr:SH3 domain-containing protein [Bacillota bacterium]